MSKGGEHSVALCDSYPVNAVLELTLVNDETVMGLVYCTDEISRSIVLKKSLNYTTLASEIRVINANCVKKKKVILAQAPAHKGENEGVDEVALPLPSVSKKAIDEREKRAISLAQESFQHINQQVRSPIIVCIPFYYLKNELSSDLLIFFNYLTHRLRLRDKRFSIGY